MPDRAGSGPVSPGRTVAGITFTSVGGDVPAVDSRRAGQHRSAMSGEEQDRLASVVGNGLSRSKPQTEES